MNNYCFFHAFDENGYPRIERELSPTDYDAYCKTTEELRKSLHNPKEIRDFCDESKGAAIEMEHFAMLDMSRLKMISQDSPICEEILYPISGHTWSDGETLKTHGIFQIITYAVLDYFGEKESLENLTQIATYGGWHHKNGTWWHYLDVVCQAYGLKTLRFGSWSEVYDKMVEGDFLAVALLDHEMFPEFTGNSLVLITSIFDGEISFFHPKKGYDGKMTPSNYTYKKVECISDSIYRFTRYTKVLWGISR